MKLATLLLLIFLPTTRLMLGSEQMLTFTWQPLDGLGSGGIHISEVTCHDYYATSGMATAVKFISTLNIPPGNKTGVEGVNLNIASLCRVVFDTSDIGNPKAPNELTMDLTTFAVPVRVQHSKEDIIRSCLECLRRCLPEKLLKTSVTLKAKEIDQSWAAEIVREFNAHDRTKVFWTPPGAMR